MWKRVLLCGMAIAAASQAAPPRLEFEVASVKPVLSSQAQLASGKIHVGLKVNGSSVDIGNVTLKEMISLAYAVKTYQIAGPGWLASARFDILARMPAGAQREQLPEMLQALLADRFKLAIHFDSKQQVVYGLLVAKGGAKLKEAGSDQHPNGSNPPAGGPVSLTQRTNSISLGEARSTPRRSGPPGGRTGAHFAYKGVTSEALAVRLSGFVDHPVLAMTGLKGKYDVELDLSMDDLTNFVRASGGAAARPGSDPQRPADDAAEPGGNSIFTAIKQLGLRLAPQKTTLREVVVDHVESTPTAN